MDLAFDDMYGKCWDTFCHIKSLEHLKNFKKWPRPLPRPKTNRTCHQNLSISWHSPFKDSGVLMKNSLVALQFVPETVPESLLEERQLTDQVRDGVHQRVLRGVVRGRLKPKGV